MRLSSAKILCLKLSLLFLAILLTMPSATSAAERSPLLQEGKKSVFQRAVSHPGAILYAGSAKDAPVLRDPVKTFTVFYIYDRKDGRLEVGTGSNKADGWVDAAKLTEWPQAITMLFTDRTGRDPVLFFRNHKALEDLCRAEDIGPKLSGYARDLAGGKPLAQDYPVIASEPQEAAVAEKNFYLLPVLGMDEQFAGQQGPRLIEVASINPGVAEKEAKAGLELRSGFVFVIDTTISMKPYIDQTLALIRKLYDDLEKSPYADKMAFAVVAFRNSVQRTPGLEYTARVVCGFTTVKNRKRLEDALAKVREATVSTHTINEDSFAGIKEAVEKLDWQDYASRIMLLVTDAGPLGAGDPDSGTGFSPEELADYLRSNKIYLTALHVKNPAAAKNQVYAADAYRRLTLQSDNKASYIPIDAASPSKGAQAFDSAAKVLAQSYSKVLTATAEGKLLEQPAQLGKNTGKPSAEDEAMRIAASTGYAMQLQFFGNRGKKTAPGLVNAWIADADLAKLAAKPDDAPILAVEPAVLLTKGQLSNLYKQLKLLLAGSEQAFLNGNGDLFTQIASAAAQMSRDPKQFSLHPDRNLADNGLLDEVLKDLPYKSRIGAMTRKDWEDMSTGQRDAFIKRIKSLLARYEAYDKDSSHWESFGATNPNDWVYRVPLAMLP